MTLEELKAKATASELTLIDRVEALVAAACDTDTLRADADTKLRDKLQQLARQVSASTRESHLTESELLGRAVYRYLKENP